MSGLEDVDWRDLTAFRAVGEELSFTRAAERLHMAQSALSRRVARLEHTLDATLLTRTSRRVALTAAGRELLTGIAELDKSWIATRAALDTLRGGTREPTTVRLGTDKVNQGEIVGRLSLAWPDTEWFSRTVGHLDALPALQPPASLDMFLAIRNPHRAWGVFPELEQLTVVTEPLWVALRADHPAARTGTVDIGELADADWLLRAEPDVEATFAATCREAGFTPRIRHIADGEDAMRDLLATGQGVAFTAPAARTPPGVVVLPWTGCPAYPLVLVWHPGQLPCHYVRAVSTTILCWYRDRARQVPRYWQYITDHPELFPGLADG